MTGEAEGARLETPLPSSTAAGSESDPASAPPASRLGWRTRLRRHNWMESIIELVIVVVGIVVASQMTNWNQDWLDRERADRYLQRIQTELVADRESIAVWRVVSGYGQAAMAHGERGALVDESKLGNVGGRRVQPDPHWRHRRWNPSPT